VSEAEFRFLSLDDVLELHEMQLESYGGATGIRAPDLLESAVRLLDVMSESSAPYSSATVALITSEGTVRPERTFATPSSRMVLKSVFFK